MKMDLHFWGGSTVFDPDGSLVAQAPYHEESLTFAQIDLQPIAPDTGPPAASAG